MGILLRAICCILRRMMFWLKIDSELRPNRADNTPLLETVPGTGSYVVMY
jgi:hypothetical protein